MATISSIHFQAPKASSEIHNTREITPDYVIEMDDTTKWETHYSLINESIQTVKDEAKQLYEQSTGRKYQKKAEPVREAVVNLDYSCFVGKNNQGEKVRGRRFVQEKLKKLGDRLQKEYGIELFQQHIHLDEGKKPEEGAEPTPMAERNLHAHLLFKWYDKKTGKSVRLNREQMREIQTITAEELGMQRGKFFSKNERLDSAEYRESAQQLDKIRKDLKAEIKEIEAHKKHLIENLPQIVNNALNAQQRIILDVIAGTPNFEKARKEVIEDATRFHLTTEYPEKVPNITFRPEALKKAYYKAKNIILNRNDLEVIHKTVNELKKGVSKQMKH